MTMRWPLLASVLLTAGCGDVTYPTSASREVPAFYTQAPQPPNFVDRSGRPPAPSLPDTVPIVSGQWTGMFQIIDGGFASRSDALVTVTQSDRAILATWRSVPSGSLQGEVRGTLRGLGSDTQLVGALTFSAPTSTPGVRCQVAGAIEGQAFPSRLWWEAPVLTLSGCVGNVSDVRLTFSR